MNKILYIMIFAICFNVYASDSEGDHSSSRDGDHGEVLIPIDLAPREMAAPDGSTLVIYEGGYNQGEEGFDLPPAPDAPCSSNAPATPIRAASLLISEPQPSKYPDLSPVVALVKQLPTSGQLMPINVISFVNHTHNPIAITVPDSNPSPNPSRLASLFTVLGTKALKDGGSLKIGLPIPIISANAQTYDADKAFNTFWGITKWHTGERYIVHYAITGVYSYKLSPEGRFIERKALALASDKVRDLILFAGHDEPGVKLIHESQLPILRTAARISATSTPKAIVAKQRK
jgi:hypothetical protein